MAMSLVAGIVTPASAADRRKSAPALVGRLVGEEPARRPRRRAFQLLLLSLPGATRRHRKTWIVATLISLAPSPRSPHRPPRCSASSSASACSPPRGDDAEGAALKPLFPMRSGVSVIGLAILVYVAAPGLLLGFDRPRRDADGGQISGPASSCRPSRRSPCSAVWSIWPSGRWTSNSATGSHVRSTGTRPPATMAGFDIAISLGLVGVR